MTTARELPVPVDLSDGQKHRILISPDAELETREGPNGEYLVIYCELENGQPAELNLTRRLHLALVSAGWNDAGESLWDITRKGEGFQIGYMVKKVGG